MPIDCLKDKVTIRPAEYRDMPELCYMVDAYNGPIVRDPEATKKSLAELLSVNGIILGEYNGEVIGGIAAVASPCLFKNELWLNVMFLYIKPKFRRYTKEFIRELEMTLLATKATAISFAVVSEEFDPKSRQLRRWMRLMGYKELEVHFYKRLVKNAD